MLTLSAVESLFSDHRPLVLTHVPEGAQGLLAADLIGRLAKERQDKALTFVHIAHDGHRSRAFQEALHFAAPHVECLDFPTWDCQPYDRVSPSSDVTARRMILLARLATTRASLERPRVLCVSVHGLLQRIPSRDLVSRMSFSAAPGNAVDTNELALWLEHNGFLRTSTVRDVGEFAVRGGLVDLYPPGHESPLRLDFFGNTLESIRTFDPQTQRTIGQVRALNLVPLSEISLTSETIRRFRRSYLSEFGAQTQSDPLYEAISQGRRYPGMEHWLPLFHDQLSTLFDYIEDAPLWLDPLVQEAVRDRFTQIEDYYSARREDYEKNPQQANYKPLPPSALYLTPSDWEAQLEQHPRFLPIPHDANLPHTQHIDYKGKTGRSFAAERENIEENVFDAVATHIHVQLKAGQRIMVTAFSDGSRARLKTLLAEHGVKQTEEVSQLTQALDLPPQKVALAVLGLEEGFEIPGLTILSESDILGERLIRHRHRVKSAQNLLSAANALQAGDLVVHADHGIGRFIGLQTITAMGAPHDCLELHYAGGDKLYLPVENIDLISRYGSGDTEVALDKLGGSAWRTRKSRLKIRIKDMAQQLIKIAAARQMQEAPKCVPPEAGWEEFCARFPYDETDDQQSAIDATLADLASGRPMDRLICGDVGFGKTEVALRAAYVAAMSGKQVAVVTPTTLLARQHYTNFAKRFQNAPLTIGQLSRIVPAARQKITKESLANGQVDIVIGTHALLGKGINFKDLGLVIVDEEQHFGVAHKERLKALRAEVHVLTLTATPIPRTLQLAMVGVRDLSIIATPPVDRLAVRTSISPFDDLMVREALLREHYRGGQSFFVCPRIEDLAEISRFLRTSVPEVKFLTAHGQLPAHELEEKISAFYDGQCDVLLSTSIVESGLDIPRANTLIVHRADRFGLGQLYQLRGRVGRAKARAYAFFTTPPNKPITSDADKRLHILETLNTLGAGFQLATHDLDLRGAGNLLGEEQSGHIKEVGFELYQQMIAQSVAALKAGITETDDEAWSPTIALGMPVTMPEHYIADIDVRMELYRRLSSIDTEDEIERIGAEMIDRFGPMPNEVTLLIHLMRIKMLCKHTNVSKLDVGPKGVIISFRNNEFANPKALVRLIHEQGNEAKVRADMSIVFVRSFESVPQRLNGARQILLNLKKLVARGPLAQNNA